MKISIIGAGSFGTALAASSARSGNDVMLWAHDASVADEIRRTGSNPSYLRDVDQGRCQGCGRAHDRTSRDLSQRRGLTASEAIRTRNWCCRRR